jgi:hypothetical protein
VMYRQGETGQTEVWVQICRQARIRYPCAAAEPAVGTRGRASRARLDFGSVLAGRSFMTSADQIRVQQVLSL